MTGRRDEVDDVLEQRLEWALRESEGGAVPPDVAMAVSARLLAGEIVAVDDEVARRRWSRWLAAAAMLLGIGVVVGLAVWARNGAVGAPVQQPAVQQPSGQQPQEPKPLPGGAAVTRLVYDLSHEELGRVLAQRPGQKAEDIVAEVVDVVQRRLGDAAKVQRLRGTTFEVLAAGGDDVIQVLRARIEQVGRLEIRVVATEDFEKDGVRFDLTTEKERLADWLGSGGREQVRGDPRNIDRFNDDRTRGPLARMKDASGAEEPALRWYPHLIRPSVEHDGSWERPFARDTQTTVGITPLGSATVAVFDEITEWNGGKVPEALLAAAKADPKKAPVLVEFVAINMKEESFGGADVDPTSLSVVFADDGRDNGRIVVHYGVKPERVRAYSDWSGRYIRKHSAIILNGCICSAPYFATRIPGQGQISGGFTEDEVEALASCLRSGEMPVRPVLLRTEQVPAPK